MLAIAFLGGTAYYYYETQGVFDIGVFGIDLTSYRITICTWKPLNPFQSSVLSSFVYIGFKS